MRNIFLYPVLFVIFFAFFLVAIAPSVVKADCEWGSCEITNWDTRACGEWAICCPPLGDPSSCYQSWRPCICDGGSGSVDNPPACSSVAVLGKISCKGLPAGTGLDVGFPSISSADHPACDNLLPEEDGGHQDACRAGDVNYQDPFVSGNAAFDVSYPTPDSVGMHMGSGSQQLWRNGIRASDPSKTLTYSFIGQNTLVASKPVPDYILFDVTENSLYLLNSGDYALGELRSGNNFTPLGTLSPPVRLLGNNYFLKIDKTIGTFSIKIWYNGGVGPGPGFTIKNIRPAWNSDPSVSCPDPSQPLSVIVQAFDDKGFDPTNGVAFNFAGPSGPWSPGIPPAPNIITKTPSAPNAARWLYTQVTDTIGQHSNPACPPVNFCAQIPNITISGQIFADTNGNGLSDDGAQTITASDVKLSPAGTPASIATANGANNPSYSFTAPGTGSYTLQWTSTNPVYAQYKCYDDAGVEIVGCTIFNPTTDKKINIAASNNISWFNSLDGDIYAKTGGILDQIPTALENQPTTGSKYWMIGRTGTSPNFAGGTALVSGAGNTITARQSATSNNQISQQGTAPGWNVANANFFLDYFLKITPTTSSSTPCDFASLAVNQSCKFTASRNSDPIYGDYGKISDAFSGSTSWSTTGGTDGVATAYFNETTYGLKINQNVVSPGANKGLVIVVPGDVTIANVVTQIDAVIIAGGKITMSPAGAQSTLVLTVNGGLYARGNIDMSKRVLAPTATPTNTTNPAVTVNFRPVYLTNTNPDLVRNNYVWKELTPQ